MLIGLGDTVKAGRSSRPVEPQRLSITAVALGEATLLVAPVERQAHGDAATVVNASFQSSLQRTTPGYLNDFADRFRRPWLVRLTNRGGQDFTDFQITDLAAAGFRATPSQQCWEQGGEKRYGCGFAVNELGLLAAKPEKEAKPAKSSPAIKNSR
jgi:hypothetical protein